MLIPNQLLHRFTKPIALLKCLHHLNSLFQVLAEVTLRPQLTIDEIESARQAVAFELETLSMRPEQETILMDMIHMVCLHNDLIRQCLSI